MFMLFFMEKRSCRVLKWTYWLLLWFRSKFTYIFFLCYIRSYWESSNEFCIFVFVISSLGRRINQRYAVNDTENCFPNWSIWFAVEIMFFLLFIYRSAIDFNVVPFDYIWCWFQGGLFIIEGEWTSERNTVPLWSLLCVFLLTVRRGREEELKNWWLILV